MVKGFLPSLLFIFLHVIAFSQDQMRVVRTKSVERSMPVDNVFVDGENNRWAANPDGVFQVFNIESGSLRYPATGQVNILSFPDGNHDLLLPRASLAEILGPAAVVTTARYDDRSKDLWIGTAEKGVFQIAVEPTVQLKAHLTTDNSKLLSNYIYTIFIDRQGRKWIGTQDGAIVGVPGKWDHYQRYFNIYAFAEHRDEVWVSTDELVWWVDSRDRWTPLELDAAMYEGPIIDLEFDSKGNLWLASEIMTHFDISVDSFKVYGPVQYFTSQFVNRIAVDQDDAVWIATEDKGLYQIEREDAINITIHMDEALSCAGNTDDAKLRAEVVGGESPYQYTWNDSLQGAIVSGLGPGLYSLRVTDANGKTKETEYEIPDPFVQLEALLDQPADPEGENGQATVRINGGVPEYSIHWDNGETTPQAMNLTPGLHTVLVTDQAGCTAEATVEVSQEFLPLSIHIEVIRDNQCYGDENAVINFHANGGQKPYISAWNNGVNMEEAEGLAAGVYTVTLTDARGDTASASIEIEQPGELVVVPQVISSASTDASDGEAALEISGGTAPYTVSWADGFTGDQVSTLPAGEHSFTVTDANGCTVSGTVLITEDILPLAAEVSEVSAPTCAESKDGKASISVKGGKGPFAYQWSMPQFDGPVADQLGSGTYVLTVTDAAGQETTLEFEVKAPEPLIVKIEREAPASEGEADGKALAIATGGEGKYTYLWDSGADGKRAANLTSGLHKVTVTDQAGCMNIASFEVPVEILALQVELVVNGQINCAGESSDGDIRAIVEGGLGPYQYTWSQDGVTRDRLSGFTAGTFAVTVSDAMNSLASAEITIDSPEPMRVQIEQTAPASTNESDGKARARVEGGTGAYTYLWDTGESIRNAANLAGGLHSLTVTDENGCTITGDIEITEDILPLAIEVEVQGSIECPGGNQGQLLALVSGGKEPFTCEWNADGVSGVNPAGLASGNYSVTVTDAQGTTAQAGIALPEPDPIIIELELDASANTNEADGKASARVSGGNGKYTYQWDTGEMGRSATNLAAGPHLLTVTDANGCTAVGEIEMTEDILPLDARLEVVQAIPCPGSGSGEIEVIARGGKPPYSFEWEGESASGTSLNGLEAGDYAVTVTDLLGTETIAQISLPAPRPIIPEIMIDASATTNESDGKATVSVSGGTGKFTYAWDTGETTKTASRLGAGMHQLTVTDENGCTSTARIEMTEDILPLTVQIEVSETIPCAGQETGALEAIIRGGKGPYQTEWNDASGNSVSPESLQAGSYFLLVTDVLGTNMTAEVLLEEPRPLSASITIDAPAEANLANGRATVNAVGGTGRAYTYAWDNGENEAVASELAPGGHTVTVTDENGCSVTATVEISENILPLAVQLEGKQQLDCYGDQDGSLDVFVQGGKRPFTFAWSDSQEGDTRSGLGAGTYRVEVTDAAGNSVSGAAEIIQPEPLEASVEVISPATTDEIDGEARAVVTGGSGSYTYAWDHGQTIPEADQLAPGVHTLTVTDGNRCTATASFEITEDILPLQADIQQVEAITCHEAENGVIRAIVSGGKKPYNYAWAGHDTASDQLSGLAASTLTVTVTDAIGQEAIFTYDLEEPDPLVADIASRKPCRTERSTDGKAVIEVQGGTSPYRYAWSNGESGPAAVKLSFGLNSVTITDANGCVTTTEVDIQKKILPELTAGMLRSGQTIKIEKLQFEADSSAMMESSIPVLTEIYEFLADNPFIVVEIGGHTNGLPSHEFCDRLSTARAKTVSDYIVGRGIDPKRIIYKGYGKRQPIATNQTPDGRRRNQRVEVKILQIEESDGD